MIGTVTRIIAFSLASIIVMAAAQAGEMIPLPEPKMSGGMPIMQALKERHSKRDFSTKVLSRQMLGNLLWAASGINRPDSGKRTAPSARNWREISIYVALADGAYRYDADKHALFLVKKEDLRAATGLQGFVAGAPVNLVYVADLERMEGASPDKKVMYSAADTGFIAQNVYLFCASEGLATVVRGSVDRETLAALLDLGDQQRVILAQTVGYPAP